MGNGGLYAGGSIQIIPTSEWREALERDLGLELKQQPTNGLVGLMFPAPHILTARLPTPGYFDLAIAAYGVKDSRSDNELGRIISDISVTALEFGYHYPISIRPFTLTLLVGGGKAWVDRLLQFLTEEVTQQLTLGSGYAGFRLMMDDLKGSRDGLKVFLEYRHRSTRGEMVQSGNKVELGGDFFTIGGMYRI